MRYTHDSRQWQSFGDETSVTGGEAEDPNQQTRAEAQGGKLRNPSRKTGGGKAPHTPAEMSEADPPTKMSKSCHKEGKGGAGNCGAFTG